MNKKIYILLTVVFILFTAFSYTKSKPELLEKGDELIPVVLHFNGKTDDTYLSEYGSSKFQPFFNETNEKLKKKNELLLITTKKEVFKLQFDRKVNLISRNNIEGYLAKKEVKSLELLDMSYIEPERTIWNVISFISFLFTIAHILMCIFFSMRNSMQKHS